MTQFIYYRVSKPQNITMTQNAPNKEKRQFKKDLERSQQT